MRKELVARIISIAVGGLLGWTMHMVMGYVATVTFADALIQLVPFEVVILIESVLVAILVGILIAWPTAHIIGRFTKLYPWLATSGFLVVAAFVRFILFGGVLDLSLPFNRVVLGIQIFETVLGGFCILMCWFSVRTSTLTRRSSRRANARGLT